MSEHSQPIVTPAEKAARRQAREVKKYLTVLTTTVQRFIALIDAEMKLPSAERGKRIAKLTNALEMQNDLALRFGLGKTKPRRNPGS